MSDKYPEKFKIEIDKQGLKRYLSIFHFLLWTILIGTIGTVVGMIIASNKLERMKIEIADQIDSLLVSCPRNLSTTLSLFRPCSSLLHNAISS